MNWFFFFLLVSLIHCMGFPGSTSGKEPACQCRRHKRCWFDPWVERSPGGGHGNPLQYYYLENPTYRGAWRAAMHWVTKSWTWPKWFSSHVHSTAHHSRETQHVLTQRHCPAHLMDYRGGRYSFHQTPEPLGWILMNWCWEAVSKGDMWETPWRKWISVLKGRLQ